MNGIPSQVNARGQTRERILADYLQLSSAGCAPPCKIKIESHLRLCMMNLAYMLLI